jgi:hypothetical protein
MTVRVNKPAINVREELADLRKPTGIAGEAMLRAETPQEQQALIGVGRRNFIINGGFAVDQRNDGAEHTKSGSSYNITGLDRWGIYYDTTKIQQKVVTIGTQTKYACRFTSGASSNTNRLYCFTKIESGSAYFSGQTAMLSFWARSNTFKRGSLEFRYYNTAESVEHASCGLFDQPDFYTDWHYYQIPVVFEEDEDGVSHDRYLFLKFGANIADVSASDWMEIADVQLELGKVATPFEHRSYGEELALCQRYYEEVPFGRITGYHTGTVRAGFQWKVNKRATPTVTFSSSVLSTGASVTLAPSGPTTYGMSINASASVASSGIQSQISIDAEL